MVLLPLGFLAKSACDPKKRNFTQINDAILVFGWGFGFGFPFGLGPFLID